MLRHIIVFLVGISLLTSCTQSGFRGTHRYLAPAHVHPDGKFRKRSNAYYYLLRGQLAFRKENFDEARIYLAKGLELLASQSSVFNWELFILTVLDGDLKAAVRIFERIVSDDQSPETLFLYARLLDGAGLYEKSVGVYSKLVVQGDKVFPVYYDRLAYAAYKAGEYQRAIELGKRVINAIKDKSSIYCYLGNLYGAQGDYKKAAQMYRKGYSKDLSVFNQDLLYGFALILSGQREKGEKVLRTIAASSERAKALGVNFDAEIFPALDNLEMTKDLYLRFAERSQSVGGGFAITDALLLRTATVMHSIAYLGIIVAVQPDRSDAIYYLSSAFASLGMRKAAIRTAMRIGRLQSLFAESRVFVAYLYKKLGKLNKAENALKEAIEGGAKDSFSLSLMLLDLLIDQGKYSEAKHTAAKLLKEHPNSRKLEFLYGSILYELGEKSQSLNIMRKLLEDNPNDGDVLNFIAYSIAQGGGDYSSALEYIGRALKLEPDNGYYIDTEGWIYFKSGDIGRAVVTLERAVNLTGDDIVIMEHYAEALLASGDLEEATAYFVRVALKEREAETQEEKEVTAKAKDELKRLLRKHMRLSSIAKSYGYAVE
ncbi:MAG: hypothetical protein D6808_05530 [Candidatus Dadabacteria bacterium]|nr:MAG: hypothetical protein D6808_05530 [Candidatus Dadabacteria bacterium]